MRSGNPCDEASLRAKKTGTARRISSSVRRKGRGTDARRDRGTEGKAVVMVDAGL